MKIKQIKIESHNLRTFEPIKNITVDKEKRTVELIWSRGTKGLRRSWSGDYYEELSMDEKAVNLSRMNNGAPVLAAHDASDLDAVIGVVERAWIQDNEGHAVVRFAKDEKSERIFEKVADGILQNVSVGYLAEYKDVTRAGDKIPTYRSENWTPMEVSIVPIGFDEYAKIRSNETLKETTINVVQQIEENVNMDNKPVKTDAELQAERTAAVAQEKQRCLEIRKLVKDAGLNEDLANEYISRDNTVEQVKVNVDLFRKYAKETQSTPVSSTNDNMSVGTEQSEARRDGIISAILHRSDSANFQLTDAGREFAGRSLIRILESHIGRNPFESDVQFAQRVMSTSDLPYILANVAQKSAQKRYELAPKTFQLWTTSGTLKDYKETLQVRGGDIGELKLMNENGEYEESSIGEEHETAKLEKYGVVHSFSDKMIINDDLSMILDIARESGVAQARLDNRLAYNALTSNPTMADGNALFSTAHANIASSGAAISESTFNDAFKAMRLQQSVDKRDQLNIAPRFLVVGPNQETAAKKFLAVIQPNQTSSVNIFSQSVQLVVDAAITDNRYYFIADPSMIDTVKVNRLQGQESVMVESRVNWRTDAIEMKLKYAVQAKAMDFRGLYLNPGQ